MARERQPVKLSSPLHLHKCLSGAYTVILTVVPLHAGECRFVRVTSVLIFPRPRLVLPLCWREHSDGRSHLPAAGSRQDLRCAPRGPGVRPAAIDTPVPAGRRCPTATQRTGRPAGAGPHARLGRTTARTRRDSSSRQHTGPPPGGNARCAYCSSPATTHSKEKRLLSISKPRRSPIRSGWAAGWLAVAWAPIFTSSVRTQPCPADRRYLASAMHWQRQPDSRCDRRR